MLQVQVVGFDNFLERNVNIKHVGKRFPKRNPLASFRWSVDQLQIQEDHAGRIITNTQTSITEVPRHLQKK
jgi:hypothetical protein